VHILHYQFRVIGLFHVVMHNHYSIILHALLPFVISPLSLLTKFVFCLDVLRDKHPCLVPLLPNPMLYIVAEVAEFCLHVSHSQLLEIVMLVLNCVQHRIGRKTDWLFQEDIKLLSWRPILLYAWYIHYKSHLKLTNLRNAPLMQDIKRIILHYFFQYKHKTPNLLVRT